MVKFMVCKHCGNIVEMIHDTGVAVVCCGEPMQEMIPGAVDAAAEKHVPDVIVEDNIVKVVVGSVEHPMTQEHLIEWIYLETDCGTYKKMLSASDAPKAEFILQNEKPLTVYAYCNLHGLWKADIL